MILFRSGSRTYTDADFASIIEQLSLEGRTVLLYSRLLSFGRVESVDAIERLVDVFSEAVGQKGTLCIPAYTFSAYRGEAFDARSAKSRVGVLGDIANSMPGFGRTVHPVYSTCCRGAHRDTLMTQSAATCFGPGSFFDLFAAAPRPYIVTMGTNLGAVTVAHYYDQLLGVPGRFLKKFAASITTDGEDSRIEFDSFVKDHEFYGDRMPCMGRLDALADEFSLIDRVACFDDWVHGIAEGDFGKLYRACAQVDPEYLLISSTDEFKDYYEKNNFRLFFGTVSDDRLQKVAAQLN
jgi:aminoglycoside 3-N-acetyltransferase